MRGVWRTEQREQSGSRGCPFEGCTSSFMSISTMIQCLVIQSEVSSRRCVGSEDVSMTLMLGNMVARTIFPR
jgi:hypothetical protein